MRTALRGRFARCVAVVMLLLACQAMARPDIFMNREWEPEFRVLRSSRFIESLPGAVPIEMQVFTCLLSISDLQMRRCDLPVADTLEANPTAGSAAPKGCYKGEYEISVEVFRGTKGKRRSAGSRYHHEALQMEQSRPEGLDPHRWHHFELDLAPGRYSWWVEFKDLNSRRHLRREGEFEVRKPDDSAASLSGLWLLAEADSLAPDPLTAPPFIEERGGAHSPELVVYYEVWNPFPAVLDLETRILDRRDRERHERTVQRDFPVGLTRNLLRVPLHELGSGDYRLELRLNEPGKSASAKKRKRDWSRFAEESADMDPRVRHRVFTVRWRGEPGTPSDLDQAVEQLRYILPIKRFRELQEAPMGMKKSRFDEFWTSVDPSPETEANELMAEYYRRAEFADRRFSWSRFAGWRSDRGRVYMIHGDPDEVERFAGNLDEPAWERWTYHENGREFIFIDRTGFGDFQLVIDPHF